MESSFALCTVPSGVLLGGALRLSSSQDGSGGGSSSSSVVVVGGGGIPPDRFPLHTDTCEGGLVVQLSLDILVVMPTAQPPYEGGEDHNASVVILSE